MRRPIMDPPRGKVVDHKNRNRLGNTRINLRVCTHAENTRKIQGTYSPHKGVSYRHVNFPEECPPERRAQIHAPAKEPQETPP